MESVIKLPKFDHSKKNFSEVLGLSLYQKHFVTSCILFEVVSNKILIDDLFDGNEEEAPIDITTKSGIMEKAFAHVTTDLEKIFFLTSFKEVFDGMVSGLALIEEAKQKRKARAEKQFDDDEDEDDNELVKQLIMKNKLKPVKEIIKQVKIAEHNFDRFIAVVCDKKVLDKIEAKRKESGDTGELEIPEEVKDFFMKMIRNKMEEDGLDPDAEDNKED